MMTFLALAHMYDATELMGWAEEISPTVTVHQKSWKQSAQSQNLGLCLPVCV